jgi:PII-like signaling protein
VNGDLTKVSAYFGERQRTGDRFTADALLDLYGAASVATSIVIRGIAGFGPRHELRSDVTLTGSEDPPIAVVAVDRSSKMHDLASQALDFVSRGLVTQESVQSADGPMPSGPLTRLTVYVRRGQRISRVLAYIAVCDALRRHGFHSATAYLGVDGTADGQRQRAAFFSRNLEVPAMVVGMGPTARAVEAIDVLRSTPGLQMLTVEAVNTCMLAGRMVAPPPGTARHFAHQKLTVQTRASAMHNGVPAHRELITRLRGLHSSAGATVFRGVWGFQGGEAPLSDSLLRVGRRVPVTTIVVDTPERIAAGARVVEEVTARRGVVTVESVPAAVWIDSGVRRGTL